MKTVKWSDIVPRAVLGGALGLLAGAFLLRQLGPSLTVSPEGGAVSLPVWLLCAALGVMAGIATLPFADDGKSLVLRSLAHFAATAVLFGLLVVQYWSWENWQALLLLEAMLALLYALIWLGRWIGWYVEVMQLRTLLGLDAGPSPLNWRETLPYLPFALLLCDGLPVLLRGAEWLIQGGFYEIPVLSALILPYVLLPAAGFTSGLSLGKRQGFCPLYPLACALFYLPVVFLLFNPSALFHCGMVGVPALAGNILGAILRRRQKM